MLGVVSKAVKTAGELIRKPWQVVRTSTGLVNMLNQFKCSGSHSHTPCVGTDTLLTGFYTRELAMAILDGLAPQVLTAAPAVPLPSDDVSDSTSECSEI